MADGDNVKKILDPLKVADGVKADAWDAFHAASDANDFKARFDKVKLPDETKAALWDEKFGREPKPVSEDAKREGAFQRTKGGRIFNAGSASEREFIDNPTPADTFGTQNQNPGLIDSVLQPQIGEGSVLRGAKGIARAGTGIITTPINLLKPPQDANERIISGAGVSPGSGPTALAIKRGLVDPALAAGKRSADAFRTAGKVDDWYSKGLFGAAGVLHAVDAALPVIGPMAESAFASAESGDTAGGVTEGLTNVAMLRKGAESAEKTGTKVATKTGKVASKPAPQGAKFQPALDNPNAAVLEHAKQEGIDLTPEQAEGEITGKQGMAEQAKVGGKQLRQAVALNQAKLGDSINNFSDRLDPKRAGLSEESAGEAIRNTVDVGKQVAHENASAAYKQAGIDQANIAGNVDKLEKFAKDKQFVKQPGAAVARKEYQSPPVQAALENIAEAPQRLGPNPSIQSMRNLRTEFWEKGTDTTGNIPNAAQALYKQAASIVDDQIMSAAKDTPFEESFRDASSQWKALKEKYDSPGGPLYKILRQKDPAKITRSLMNNASAADIEVLKNEGMDAALEPLRRQVVNDIARNKFNVGRDGLGGYSHSFLNTLLGPDAVKELYVKGELARRMNFDVNPSRTAKLTATASQTFNPLEPFSTTGNIAKYAWTAKKNMPKKAASYLDAPSSRYRIAPPLIAAGTLPALQTGSTRNAGLLPSPSE